MQYYSTALDLTFTTRHIHDWVMFQFWPSFLFILSGAVFPLFPSSVLKSDLTATEQQQEASDYNLLSFSLFVVPQICKLQNSSGTRIQWSLRFIQNINFTYPHLLPYLNLCCIFNMIITPLKMHQFCCIVPQVLKKEKKEKNK